jgi:hypothetical protein
MLSSCLVAAQQSLGCTRKKVGRGTFEIFNCLLVLGMQLGVWFALPVHIKKLRSLKAEEYIPTLVTKK